MLIQQNTKSVILVSAYQWIFSSVAYRTYSCTNYEKSYVTCNCSNIIYLITCSNCFMQYLGGTAWQLSIRFATPRVSMSEKIKSNFCEGLVEHFSRRPFKNAEHNVQIIEKCQWNGRNSYGVIKAVSCWRIPQEEDRNKINEMRTDWL